MDLDVMVMLLDGVNHDEKRDKKFFIVIISSHLALICVYRVASLFIITTIHLFYPSLPPPPPTNSILTKTKSNFGYGNISKIHMRNKFLLNKSDERRNGSLVKIT